MWYLIVIAVVLGCIIGAVLFALFPGGGVKPL